MQGSFPVSQSLFDILLDNGRWSLCQIVLSECKGAQERFNYPGANIPPLRSLRSTSLVYQRLLFGLGQAETPGSPSRGTFFSGESHHDYVGGRQRIIETSQPAPGFTIRFSQVFAQGVVHNDNSGGMLAPG